MADSAVFYYDLASPDAYLAAERVVEVLGGVAQWEPVLLEGLRGGSLDAFRCGEERDVYMVELERRAAAQGAQPIRWPPDATASCAVGASPQLRTSGPPCSVYCNARI